MGGGLLWELAGSTALEPTAAARSGCSSACQESRAQTLSPAPVAAPAASSSLTALRPGLLAELLPGSAGSAGAILPGGAAVFLLAAGPEPLLPPPLFFPGQLRLCPLPPGLCPGMAGLSPDQSGSHLGQYGAAAGPPEQALEAQSGGPRGGPRPPAPAACLPALPPSAARSGTALAAQTGHSIQQSAPPRPPGAGCSPSAQAQL